MKLSVVLLLFALRWQEGHCSEDKRLLLHDAESIAAIIQRLETRIDVLNSTHSKELAELKAAHAREVTALKAGLNAEKLERCRTGAVYFGHESCASGQCSQSKNVTFSPPFTKIPVVTFAFSCLDVSGSQNLRIDSSVSGVTTSSATLAVNTWSTTIVYTSKLSWIACPNI